jgi:hypothetical protein
MATSIFDHPVVLLIIVAASLLRWLWQKSQGEKQDTERPVVPDQPIPRGGETKTEEERIRRFLEALGQPATSTPPQKVTPRTPRNVLTHVPPLPSPLPRLTTVPPPLPTVQTSAIPASPPPPIKQRIFKPAIVQETGFEVRDIALQTSSETPGVRHQADAKQPGLRFKLAAKENLRSAIILREIFGPPRSLQPFDPINSL